MGAPGGPFVQGFGHKQRPELPKGHVGCQVRVVVGVAISLGNLSEFYGGEPSVARVVTMLEIMDNGG